MPRVFEDLSNRAHYQFSPLIGEIEIGCNILAYIVFKFNLSYLLLLFAWT